MLYNCIYTIDFGKLLVKKKKKGIILQLVMIVNVTLTNME